MFYIVVDFKFIRGFYLLQLKILQGLHLLHFFNDLFIYLFIYKFIKFITSYVIRLFN